MGILFGMRGEVVDVGDEPEIILGCWRLLEFEPPGEPRLRRLVGITRSGGERTRITSPVVSWDWAASRAVTESGRVYRLEREDADPSESAIVDAFVSALGPHGGADVTARVEARGGAWPAHDA